MQRATLSMLIFSLLLLFSTSAVIANEWSNNKANNQGKLVTMKCHVVLVNGNETIAFWRLSYKKSKNMSSWVVGTKILPQGSAKKVKIYSVYECVLNSETFSTLKSQRLDNKVEQ